MEFETPDRKKRKTEIAYLWRYICTYDLGGFLPSWFRSSSRKYSKYFPRPGPLEGSPCQHGKCMMKVKAKYHLCLSLPYLPAPCHIWTLGPTCECVGRLDGKLDLPEAARYQQKQYFSRGSCLYNYYPGGKPHLDKPSQLKKHFNLVWMSMCTSRNLSHILEACLLLYARIYWILSREERW